MSTFFSSFFLRFSRCDTYVRLDLFHHFSLRFLRKQKAGKEGERKGNLFTSLFYEGKKKNESKWEGECFVFDSRVSVDHSLQKGAYELCFACRMPLTEAQRQEETYLPGLSCPHCFGTKSQAQTDRYKMRQKQVSLAKQRGETHIGKLKP